MKKTKKICLFTTGYDFVRQIILEHYERILPKEIQIFLFCPKNEASKFKLKRTKIKEYSSSKYISFKELRKFCKEESIDVLVNLSGTGQMAATLLASTIFSNTKYIFYFHGDPKINFQNLIFLISQFFTYRFLSGSISTADKVKKFLFLSKYKIFYQPHPFDINKFPLKDKKKFKRQLGFNAKDKIIIFVGRIHPSKGSDYLLEIINKNPDKKFLLLGNLLDENYKKQKRNNVLIKTVDYKNISDYYNAADLCVFLSKRDGYSYIPREAAACGTPSIISDLDSFRPMDSEAIIKVPFDIPTIQKEIDNFFNLPEKRRKELGKIGRQFVIKNSSDKYIKPALMKYLFDF